MTLNLKSSWWIEFEQLEKKHCSILLYGKWTRLKSRRVPSRPATSVDGPIASSKHILHIYVVESYTKIRA